MKLEIDTKNLPVWVVATMIGLLGGVVTYLVLSFIGMDLSWVLKSTGCSQAGRATIVIVGAVSGGFYGAHKYDTRNI